MLMKNELLVAEVKLPLSARRVFVPPSLMLRLLKVARPLAFVSCATPAGQDAAASRESHADRHILLVHRVAERILQLHGDGGTDVDEDVGVAGLHDESQLAGGGRRDREITARRRGQAARYRPATTSARLR